MNKARNSLCILMACLLVAIQQIGFAHALTHLNGSPHQTSRTDKQHPAEKACIECVAFAQIGSGLTGTLPAILPVAARIAFVSTPLPDYAPAFVPAFRSRAPPAVL